MLMFSKIRNKQIHNWPGISLYGSAKFGLLDKARVEGKKPTDARNKCYLFVQWFGKAPNVVFCVD